MIIIPLTAAVYFVHHTAVIAVVYAVLPLAVAEAHLLLVSGQAIARVLEVKDSPVLVRDMGPLPLLLPGNEIPHDHNSALHCCTATAVVGQVPLRSRGGHR